MIIRIVGHAVLCMLLAGACTATGDRTVALIHDTPSCASCTLALDTLFTIGDADGPGMLESSSNAIVRDGQGRFLVTRSYGNAIQVFDSTGRFMQRVGVAGGGPGEFREISMLHVGTGDSVHVVDWALSRRTVLDSEFRFARSASLDVQLQMVPALLLPGGELLVNHAVGSPAGAGFPLHLLGTDGSIIRSFTETTDSGAAHATGATSSGRALAHAADGLAWSATRTAYELHLIEPTTGRLVRRLSRRTSWFPELNTDVVRERRERGEPVPWVSSIHEDARGLLRVHSRVPDPRWRTAIREGSGSHPIITDPLRYTDSMLEVIDPRTGTLVVSRRFDAPLDMFLGDDLVIASTEDADGNPRFLVMRMRIDGW